MRLNSFLSTKCKTGKSKIEGMGIFANQIINKGELVAVWGGSIYTADELKEICEQFPHFSTHPFGVYEGFYMGPNNPSDPLDDAELFNHSCDPNVGVKGQIVVVARKKIEPGEELCFDYETVEISSDALGFICRCGSKKCRKNIDGSAWRSIEFQKQNNGFLSSYIQDIIRKK